MTPSRTGPSRLIQCARCELYKPTKQPHTTCSQCRREQTLARKRAQRRAATIDSVDYSLTRPRL